MKKFVFLFLLLFISTAHAKDAPLRVHFIDVGYGDAILINLPDQSHVLIDAGDQKHSKQLLKYLNKQEVERIHWAVITHPHDNHYRGFERLLDQLSFDMFYINDDQKYADEKYSELMAIVKEKLIPTTVLRRYIRVSPAPDVFIDVLNPEDLLYGANGNSLVLLLTYKETSFLFSADINVKQQNEILTTFPDIVNAQVVQFPNHGGALSDQWAEQMNKAMFVVSSGKNTFGKPFESHLKKVQGKLYRTDKDGSIIFESDGRKIKKIRAR